MCCGAAVRAESPLGDLDRVEVNLNLISMTIVVIMIELVQVEVTKNLMLRVTVVIMPDWDRMEVIFMTMVVVMMVLDRVEVTKNLMWMATGVIMTDLDLVEVILMMMVVIMMVIAEIAMIITMKDLDRWPLQIVHCEITLHLSISQGAFRRIDRNKDGFITWEEFQRVCKRFFKFSSVQEIDIFIEPRSDHSLSSLTH